MKNNLNFIVDNMEPKGGVCEGVQNAQINIAKNLEKDYDEIDEQGWWLKTKKNWKYWVIYNWKISCDCIYDEIEDKGSSLPFLKVRQGKKYWLIGVQWENLLDLEYDDLKLYKEWCVLVKKDGKRWLRHATQPYNTGCIYDEILYRYWNYFYILVDWKMGALNKKGEVVIDPQFQRVDECMIPNTIMAKRFEDGKIAIFDENWNQISDFVYDNISLNLMDETKDDGEERIFTRKKLLVMDIWDYKWILNENWEFLPAEYDDFGDKWTEWLLPAKKNWKWWVINEKWEKIVDFMYDWIKSFLWWLAIVELNWKHWLINNIWEVILEPKLDKVRNFWEWIGWFNENGNSWFINNKWEKLKRIEYDTVREFRGWIMSVQQWWKWWFIDKNLNLICDLKYDATWDFYNGRAFVQTGNKYWYIDRKWNEICDIKYENVKDFMEWRAIVKRDWKCWVIDMEWNEIYFGIEGTIMDFSWWLAAVCETKGNEVNRSYFIDKNGKEIGKDRCYTVAVSLNWTATARKNWQYVLLNEQWEEIDRDWDLKSEWINQKK